MKNFKLFKRIEYSMTESIKKTRLSEKAPKVWSVVLGYKNMPSWRIKGEAAPYFEEAIYCPTVTSLSKKIMDSIAYACGGDDELMEYLFKDDSPEFKKMLATLLDKKYAVYKYSDKFDTVITLSLEEVPCIYVQPTSALSYPTVVAASNFIEVTAVKSFVTNGDVVLVDNDDLFLNKEPYEEEYELTYLKIDSIVGVMDDYHVAKRLKIKFGSDKCKIGSTIYTTIPRLRKINVLESAATVLARIKSSEFERAEISVLEGEK